GGPRPFAAPGAAPHDLRLDVALERRLVSRLLRTGELRAPRLRPPARPAARLGRELAVVRADDEHGDPRRLRALVVPRVARAVLHDGVAGAQVHLLAAVELEPDLAVEHDLEVDRVGRVHAGRVGLHVLREAGQLLLELARGRGRVGGLRAHAGRLRRQRRAPE